MISGLWGDDTATPAEKKMVEEELKKDLVPPPTSVLVVDRGWEDGYSPFGIARTRIADFVKNCPTL